METIIVNLVVQLITHAPELVREIQEIVESKTMTPEQKAEAYKVIKLKLNAVNKRVDNAVM